MGWGGGHAHGHGTLVLDLSLFLDFGPKRREECTCLGKCLRIILNNIISKRKQRMMFRIAQTRGFIMPG